ncbi:accessory gene regulator protein AgrB [Clostridium punense]|uniref:Accessory gene regulator protein AgrB n=1 Tax=Clostridium punense TaxID=1054297 RepID=A0ABS4K9C5_9CLOT|nr:MULTISPECIES: DUF5058 family protein [Clostridium]EQB88774.1 hypothetical protein M918_23025 [Clostridium sp. BL8]MBP2023940.1 accessory gene regulator protein AgrB [Clostridium punense]
MDIMKQINSLPIYAVCSTVIILVAILCITFIVKSYRAGLKIGMDKTVLKRIMISSATFTIIPSVSILLGVIALSGSLGIPLPWMRLSIIGALHYETTVAEIAASSTGMSGLVASEMTAQSYTSIAMLMGVGIMWGAVVSIFFLKKYLSKFSSKPKKEESKSSNKTSFGDIAMLSMFIGLCSAYLCSYVGMAIRLNTYMPLIVSILGAVSMAVFSYIKEKKKALWLDNFSLAGSMLIAMTGAVILNLVIGGLV